jgi:hypothetical protein
MPAASSVGASSHGLAPRFDLDLFELVGGDAQIPQTFLQASGYPFCVSWDSPGYQGVAHRITFTPQGTTGHVYDFSELKTRMLAHLIVDLLPQAAMHELVDSLKSSLEFYQQPESVAALPGRTTRTAKIVRRTRPEIELTED